MIMSGELIDYTEYFHREGFLDLCLTYVHVIYYILFTTTNCTNVYLLCCSKFSYMSRPLEAFLRENTEAVEYNFGIKCRREFA